MNYHTQSQVTGQSPRLGGDVIGVLHGLFSTPFIWLERAQARRRLADLDDHMLRDIGLSRSEAEDVAHTPFWRP
jgi:uncharacterized protein YjiS (DUF1127 family)